MVNLSFSVVNLSSSMVNLSSSMVPYGIPRWFSPVPESANRQSAAESAEEQDADSVKERKKRKSGATLEQNVAAIRKTVDSIFETLVKQNDFIKKQFGLARKLEEDKKRKAKEERFEGGKGDKKAKKAVDKIAKPFSNILDKIINFFAAIFLGKALLGLVSWFGDPDNQSKVESIGRVE